MKSINSETDTLTKLSAFEKKLHKCLRLESNHVLQICDLSTCESPLMRFWFETLNENKQGQKQALVDLETSERIRRRRTGMKVLSYTQLLESLRHFAIQRGLPLYGILQKKAYHKLQHN